MRCNNDWCKKSFADVEITKFFKEDKWVGSGVQCPCCESRLYLKDYRKHPRSKQVAREADMRQNASKSKQLSLSEKPKVVRRRQLERCAKCGWKMPSVWIHHGLCGRCSQVAKS